MTQAQFTNLINTVAAAFAAHPGGKLVTLGCLDPTATSLFIPKPIRFASHEQVSMHLRNHPCVLSKLSWIASLSLSMALRVP